MEQANISLQDQITKANQSRVLNPTLFESTLREVIAFPLTDEQNNEANLRSKEQAYTILA
jgi:hypothetical protein